MSSNNSAQQNRRPMNKILAVLILAFTFCILPLTVALLVDPEMKADLVSLTSRFPRTGEVTIITPELGGILRWTTEKGISGAFVCRVSGDPYIPIAVVESGYCIKERVLRALQNVKDGLPAGAHEESSDYAGWLEEAIRTVSALEGEELVRSGLPTSTPGPANLEVAVLVDATTNETDGPRHALQIHSILMDRWRDHKQEACGTPFQTPIPETEPNKYPESVLVVENPEWYEPDRNSAVKIVALDSFDQREFPVLIRVTANFTYVKGPDYNETGQGPGMHSSYGYRTAGSVELSVRGSERPPVRFTGDTQPEFPSSVDCPGSLALCLASISGSGGAYDFIDQLLKKGLDLAIENAAQATVVCP